MLKRRDLRRKVDILSEEFEGTLTPEEEAEDILTEIAKCISNVWLETLAGLRAAGHVRGGPDYLYRLKHTDESKSIMERKYGPDWTTEEHFEEAAERVFTRETFEKCARRHIKDEDAVQTYLDDLDFVEEKEAWIEMVQNDPLKPYKAGEGYT